MFVPGPEAMDYRVTPLLDTIIKWLMFTVTILGVSVITSKFQAYGNIPFNIPCGIVVLIAMKPVFFEALKLSTLLVGRIIVLFACFGLLPGPGLWLLFRASTLTFGGILQIGCKRWFEENFMVEPLDRKVQHIKNSKPIQIACTIICSSS